MKTIVLALVVVMALALPVQEEVTKLNGYYDFTKEFQMYSGYLNLQESPLIANHYIFITSKGDPKNDPLVLWLNGGPGCSSMLGFIQQFGPHVLKQGSDKLQPTANPYSWNAHANMLFIESPPGVGFSVNKDPNYNKYNDSRTALDNLNSLRSFFKKFPEFQNHKFWISGESYAGMYLPTLADQIIQNQDSIIDGGKLDFQGLLIGNGAMNMDIYWRLKVTPSYFDAHYYFGPEIGNLVKTCKWDASDDKNPSCLMGLKLADDVTDRINAYNPIGICYNQVYSYDHSHSVSHKRGYKYTPFYARKFRSIRDDEPDCDTDDTGLIKFMNDPEVQAQLHVQKTDWTPCSDEVGERYQWGTTTVPLFDSFKKAGLKMMFYSGNVDAVCPSLQTEEYIRQLGWKVDTAKVPVYNPFKSLEGWMTKYENNLIYYVINGAGHMVPCEKPHAAYNMFNNFIHDKL